MAERSPFVLDFNYTMRLDTVTSFLSSMLITVTDILGSTSPLDKQPNIGLWGEAIQGTMALFKFLVDSINEELVDPKPVPFLGRYVDYEDILQSAQLGFFLNHKYKTLDGVPTRAILEAFLDQIGEIKSNFDSMIEQLKDLPEEMTP